MSALKYKSLESFADEDKIPYSRLDNEDFDAILDEVVETGMKLVIDDEGNPKCVIMSVQLYEDLLRDVYPEDCEKMIQEIRDACAEYQEEDEEVAE